MIIKDYFLSFPDADTYTSLSESLDPEDATILIDAIGTVSEPTGELTTDPESGTEYPVMRPVPGWYVNVRCTDRELPDGWAQYIIPRPETPVREFAPWIEAPSTANLDEAKASKIIEIVSGSNKYTSLVKGRYSELEIDSWAVQAEQARTVLSGGILEEGSLLRVLAKANGVEVKDFAQRVLNNVEQADALTKIIVSQQQAMELQVKAATTVQEVEAITVVYALP